jgi:hypothetical protein
MIVALGEIDSPLQQTEFILEEDKIITSGGETINNYFKEKLNVKYFSPVDKTHFKQSPSGWCSWYYYGRDITPEELLVNARWFAENMKEYGLDLILLDDGWQGGGRDWTGLRETFPKGMKSLADDIKSLGLMPGIWYCPQGQENQEVVKDADCFLLNPDGSSVCGTFGGPYTVDGSNPKTKDYLSRLTSMLVNDWGYEYLKLDGQPTLVSAYIEHQNAFSNPEVQADEAYRNTLQWIRQGAGGQTFLCGCSGMPTEAVGLYDGQRTGADVDAEWNKGFMNAVEATMQGMFLHNTGWFSDPDCCMLRSPLTVDMGRAWGSLMALTGQMLLFSDRMPDLGAERIEIIKRISPPCPDIRPFDLFPSTDYKRIIDCKINHCGRVYDVLGMFNYNDTEVLIEHLDFAALGLDENKKYHIYDFWNSDYLGQYEKGIFVEIAPASCRVLTICETGELPVLLSTNRHVLQGYPDIQSYNADGNRISGCSSVIAGEKYTLTFAMPMRDEYGFESDGFSLNSGENLKVDEGRGCVRVSWIPAETGNVDWEMKFKKSEVIHPGRKDTWAFMTGVKDIDPWTVEFFWVSFGSPAAFAVWMDEEFLGYTFSDRVKVGGLDYLSEHKFEVTVADLDGTKYEERRNLTARAGETLDPQLYLSDLDWKAAGSGYWMVKKDKNVSGGSLAAGGKRFRKGFGSHPCSRIEYNLPGGIFKKLSGYFGIEDQNGLGDDIPDYESGRAVFSIRGDGKELLKPQMAVKGEKAVFFELDMAGIEYLELLIDFPEDQEVRNLAPHADWLDMRLEF